MSDKTVLVVGEREFPLRFTMRRVELLEELTGVDLLNPGKDGARALTTGRNVTKTLYALAGGEDATGLSLAAFSDELTVRAIKDSGPIIMAVFERDAGEGGDPKAGASGKQ